ncbi:protease, partial [Candidatus Saccharibacteria bacterium]|nr:protease [Candidatus Saccharibacteria bacterium]
MYKQIAANKRKTVFLIFGFVIFIGLIGAVLAWAMDSWTIAIWTLVIALVYALIQYFASSSLAVAMTGAREIEKKDNPKLYNTVENLALTAGLPMP